MTRSGFYRQKPLWKHLSQEILQVHHACRNTVVGSLQHTRRMNHQIAAAILRQHPQSPGVTVLLRRLDFGPFTFTESLVDEEGTLRSGARDNGAVLASVWCPHNVRGRSWLSTTRDHQALMRSIGDLLGVRGDSVVEGERVGRSSEEGAIFVDVEIFAVRKL